MNFGYISFRHYNNQYISQCAQQQANQIFQKKAIQKEPGSGDYEFVVVLDHSSIVADSDYESKDKGKYRVSVVSNEIPLPTKRRRSLFKGPEAATSKEKRE